MHLVKKITASFILIIVIYSAKSQTAEWKHLSTTDGSIPMPWQSTEQTGALVGDLNNDGLNDFVLTCRKKAASYSYKIAVGKATEQAGWQILFVIAYCMLRIRRDIPLSGFIIQNTCLIAGIKIIRQFILRSG